MCRPSLRLVGLWPNLKKEAKYAESVSRFLFVTWISTILLFVNIAQTTKLIMIWGDLIKMAEIISTSNLPIATMVLKMILLYKKQGRTYILLLEYT